MIHHYHQLGLIPGATAEEIRASFRLLAKKFHPDVAEGSTARFAEIRKAYEALRVPAERARFERLFRGGSKPQPGENSPRNGEKDAADGPAEKSEEGTWTRLMSIAIPRDGTILVEGFAEEVVIEPTTPESLWETTLAKFGFDRNRLCRHVIQVRVTGGRGGVQRVIVEATYYGVRIFAAPEPGAPGGPAGQKLFATVLFATVPAGLRLFLRENTGSITLGNLEGVAQAQLAGQTMLRAGRLTGAGVTLAGKSRAYLADVTGDVDVLAADAGKVLLDGKVERLRAVMEGHSSLEVLAPVQALWAEATGQARLFAKGAVREALCHASQNGFMRISTLQTPFQGSQTGNGRIEVVNKQMNVPVSRNARRPTAGVGG